MRIFLFKLFLRCVNLINPESRSVQQVLFTLVFIILLDTSDHA